MIMKASPRQTASQIQQQHDSLKEEVIRTIKEIIEEKQIKLIEVHSDYHITSYYHNGNNYFTIKDIHSDGASEYEDSQYDNFETKSFEELELNTLIQILELLEGDITTITKGEDDEEEYEEEEKDF